MNIFCKISEGQNTTEFNGSIKYEVILIEDDVHIITVMSFSTDKTIYIIMQLLLYNISTQKNMYTIETNISYILH